jgi:hypothetical protein
MESRFIGLEQFLEFVLPAIANQTRETLGEFDVISGAHALFGKIVAIQGVSSAVLIMSER